MSRIVIKVGSHVLSQEGKLSTRRMRNLVALICRLWEKGREVILVSSGAVAAGFTLLPVSKASVTNKQALAAIGQPLLMKHYQEMFAACDKLCSQMLLSADVFESKEHIAHAKAALDTLLSYGVTPVINENDTVSVEELVFGDNDRLSAHVTYHFDAEMLVILSDIDAYYDKDPNRFEDASACRIVKEIPSEALEATHTPNNEFATGGIVTKLQAAHYLMRRKKKMYLASGFDLRDAEAFLLEGKHRGGTLFESPANSIQKAT